MPTTMTNQQRHRLAERYVELLDEGRLDLLQPIFDAAERDAELAELIAELTEGAADEAGFALSPADHERLEARIDAAAGKSPGGPAASGCGGPVPSREATVAQNSPAHGRTFLAATRDLSGKSMTEAAAALGGTVHFFSDLNRYPDHPDLRVRALLPLVYALNAERNGVPVEISADAMEHNNPLYDLAAYAEDVIDHSVPTFEEILEDSDMTEEQQAYWRAEAERRAAEPAR